MLNLGLIGFAQPWLLTALASLPALYLLLRLTPPSPQRIHFPPIALLKRLVTPEETPARTPWWLLLLRLLIAALVILALAQPILNPSPAIPGRGPVALIVDNGWASAAHWEARRSLADDFINQAERGGREVVIFPTAPTQNDPGVDLRTPQIAREYLRSLEPVPWASDHATARRSLDDYELEEISTVWLSDGLMDEDAGETNELARYLAERGPLNVIAPSIDDQVLLLREPDPAADPFAVTIERSLRGEAQSVDVTVIGPEGEVMARSAAAFGERDLEATATFDMPLDMRNRMARLQLSPDQGIAGTILFDERWRRRSIGIAGDADRDNSQPLLAHDYYVERALRPYAEIRKGEISTLLDLPLSMIVLTDRGRIEPDTRQRLEDWVEDGGVLLRFAGPKLAVTEAPLVPVPLRTGDRQLGGALSWSKPLGLQEFPTASPFAGLVPAREITVSRQVLAQPGPDVGAATLAALTDGTPLVTGERRGQGWLILVHTTANTAWTSLPISGLFVDMLRRLSELGRGTPAGEGGFLALDEMLDATGRLVAAPGDLPAIPASEFANLVPGPWTPPGLYGDPEIDDGVGARRAFNLQAGIGEIQALRLKDMATSWRGYGTSSETDLLPHLLTLALVLAMIDMLIGLAFRGLLPRLQGIGSKAAATGIALLMLLAAHPVRANDDLTALHTAETRLAYILTGLAEIDAMSEAGLIGLGQTLGRRTSIETGDPVGVTIGVTDLAIFPFIYWPVPPDHPDLPPDALANINTYLRHGGLILFDTGDAARLLPGQAGGGPGERRLRQLLGQLDLPPLREVPPDHTLTRAFYLMADFPGRFTGQPVWVDATPASVNDGVAGVVIGGHDWAAAWAVDEYGNSLRPVIPGGERQREMARRFGVNLAMYALTGNYKTDQVHVPALLERLGQ